MVDIWSRLQKSRITVLGVLISIIFIYFDKLTDFFMIRGGNIIIIK